MRTVKTLGVTLGALLFLGGYVYAQEQSNAPAQSNTQTQSTTPAQSGPRMPPATVDDVVKNMTTNLNLTQEQAAAIRPIIEQTRAKQKALRETLTQQGANRDTIRSQMKQLRAELDQQLSQILTQDQVDKMMARRANADSHSRSIPNSGTSQAGQ